MSTKPCPFCLEITTPYGEIVRRGQYHYLLSHPDPVLPDSFMLIPFRHLQTPFELNQEEWLELKSLLQEAKHLLDAKGAEGYTLGWNVGEVAGQTVPHAHLHIIARFGDEPLVGQGIRHHLKQESNRRKSG